MAVPDDDRPPQAPSTPGDARTTFADAFLVGEGLEIGALHLAMALPTTARARYVDRMSVVDLRAHYPELKSLDLAEVDVVDDGERLTTIAPESVDFIVANHFLEHCQDPIATVETHLSKLRPGGVLFYAVPDKRYTFDFRRDRTTLQHVLDDHEHGPQHSRADHYLQWASHVHEGTGPPSPEQAQAYAHQLEAEDYSIHFHVWTAADLTELMLHIQERHGGFEVETIHRNGIENIAILRRDGEPDPAPVAVDERDPELPAAVVVPRRTVVGGHSRIPLSALHGRAEPSPADVHWSIDPDGATGRGLVQSADSRWIIEIATARPVQLVGRVRLLPHDWRDGTRAVRAVIRGDDGTGERDLWSASLASAVERGREEGAPVRCDVPAGLRSLVLAVEAPAIRDAGSAARAAWMDAAILDPATSSDAPAPVPPPFPRADVPNLGTSGRPLFSILTPVHDPPLWMLRAAVASVDAQTFDDWELCLVDDGSRDPEIIGALRALSEADPRIRYERSEASGGISAATNAALALACGEYVTLLDHDDLLVPNALELMAEQIADDPSLDMVYSDEAVVVDGRRVTQILKPGWSPESFTCHMYACHLGVYRRAIADAIGGFRVEFDGCQDYDFVLRFTERTSKVAHIPAQLYHWRAHSASTAGGGEAKPHAFLLQPRAIAEHLERAGIEADVQFGSSPGLHRIVHRVPTGLSVSVVLALADPQLMPAVLESLRAQAHPAWTLLVGVTDARRVAVEAAVGDDVRVQLVATARESTPAQALAQVADQAGGDRIIFLQDPIAGLTADWLRALVGYAGQTDVAAAGGLVLDAQGRIVDSGYAFPDGVALPLMAGFTGQRATSIATNVSAVNLALATRAETFRELGGLDPTWGALTLLDYCLRAGGRGLRTVTVPDARLRRLTSGSPLNDLEALWRLRDAWTGRPRDPLYNPNFRTDLADFSPRERL